ncbi:hypothetical protein [Absidia glauca]|uniref:Uncharacterized protein n=1 Tax=Absidia glauca TaxID=4829 RepID=A0A163KQE4_ABSGL|nr:hypothetical protein [Absidia glauca]
MKTLSFYLLVTAMALMKTVSAQPPPISHMVLFCKTGSPKKIFYDDCFNVENVVNVGYVVPATCQYFTDMTCKKPTSDPPVTHARRAIAPPKNSKGYVKCFQPRK